MRYLLDSQVFLWYKDGNSPLSQEHREHLDDFAHELLLSVASVWELTIKRALGKIEFSGSFAKSTQSSGIRLLPIELGHVEEMERLPRLGRDPFDHLLIAQARVEGLILVTRDRAIHGYDVPTLRV